jgi:hypothetical protein
MEDARAAYHTVARARNRLIFVRVIPGGLVPRMNAEREGAF